MIHSQHQDIEEFIMHASAVSLAGVKLKVGQEEHHRMEDMYLVLLIR